jgi:uncharacterized protein YlzI (FlbEa/FlbD family)
MIPVELDDGRRVLLNEHVILAIQDTPGGAVIFMNGRSLAVSNTAARLVEAIEDVHRRVRAAATDKLSQRSGALHVVADRRGA